MKRYYPAADTLAGMTKHPEGDYMLVSEHEAIIKRQAAAALNGMNAAKAISYHDLQQAHRLRAESNPEALDSERAMNATLTAENERLQNEVSDLRAFIDVMKAHVTAAASMYGLKRT